MKRGAVIGGIAGRDAPLGQQAMKRGSPLHLAVIVRAEAAGQKAKTGQHVNGGRCRIGDTLLEPAVGPRADAGQHNAAVVRFAQNCRQFPRLPQGQQALRVAAAYIDDVLRQQEGARILRRTGEEGEMAGPAAKPAEGLVEAQRVLRALAAGLCQETDIGIWLAGLLDDVLVKGQVVRLHGKAAAAQGDDLPHRVLLCRSVWLKVSWGCVLRSGFGW